MEHNEALLEATGGENLAETLARELKTPTTIASPADGLDRHLVRPARRQHQVLDDDKVLDHPRRAKAAATAEDLDSFIGYLDRNATDETTTVWCKADMVAGLLRFTALLNDHDPGSGAAGWRDHTCSFEPRMSVEWKRWQSHDRKPFDQVAFATFIEDNRGDIASVEGMPTGAQMLEMALSMEATQDVRFKSAIRLANGGVQLQFVQDDDAQTLARMQLFERFSIGLPVFWNGDAYRLDARLRYRVRDGKVTFWYELERPDRVFESAARTLVDQVRERAGAPFFFGAP
jgi:uncharacterized protein YfdQ (DUF2303 family)